MVEIWEQDGRPQSPSRAADKYFPEFGAFWGPEALEALEFTGDASQLCLDARRHYEGCVIVVGAVGAV